jgi:hypothetical protein
MSVLPNQTNLSDDNSFFLKNTNDITLISSMNLYNGNLNISQINLDSIQMDAAIINGYPTLLLNGAPVAGVSSLTSSITSWSSYPALQPITYAAGGGTANLNNVNALTNLSSATVTSGTVTNSGAVNTNTLSTGSIVVSTINGVPFPAVAFPAALNVEGGPITNGISIPVDCSALPAGFYLLEVLISSDGTDPFTCSAVVRQYGAAISGGSLHCPSIAGAVPSFANCVSIQDAGAASNTVNVIIYANSSAALGRTAQISLHRLT